MISVILGVIRQIIPLIPCIILIFLSRFVNLKKPDRCRQFPMPVITLAYCIVTAVLMTKISNLVRRLIQLLSDFLSNNDTLGQFGDTLLSLISHSSLRILIFAVVNVLIILVYFVIKRIVLSICKGIFKDESTLLERAVSTFYTYDEIKGRWLVARHAEMALTFMRIVYRAVIVISIEAAMDVCYLLRQGYVTALFYPVFAILVLGDLYFFLDGKRYKDVKDINGEVDPHGHIVNYALLRPILRKLFGDKLTADNTTVDSKLLHFKSNDDLLKELEDLEEPLADGYACFLRHKVKTGLDLDQNYVLSGYNLLKGSSILFNNPFYYDLIPYAFYAMNRTLLQHKKVLIILGRHGAEEDIIPWCDEGIKAVTNIYGFWNIGVLDDTEQDPDIGIITRSNVYNLKLHEQNEAFFRQVEYVVLIEPSKLITTAQIGLNSLVQYCRKGKDKKLVYCSTDINCDGLVDALSHVLLTSIQEVSATGHHQGSSSYMCWKSDDEHLQHRLLPNISRYLGVGTELSFVALKNQVCETEWYGGNAFPVVDMKWIAGQYYFDLLNYAELPATQESMDEHFHTRANLYDARIKKHQYMTVEDENHNMFEARRLFATRASEQGFVNIISGDYLLRDYMAQNNGIFDTDPKAIPYIVADYARTRRNVVLRLCLQMSAGHITDEQLSREMLLLDTHGEDLRLAFWHTLCEDFQTKGQIVTNADNEDLLICRFDGEERQFNQRVIRSDRKYSLEKDCMETRYFIRDEIFIKWFLSDLQSAAYIAEDEKGERQFLGIELQGQVMQHYLPGQFLVFNGKSYEMQQLTSDGLALVRRASDHIDGRYDYRQERNYYISYACDSQQMGDCVKIDGIKVSYQYADLHVQTPAYWRMSEYHNFETAKRISVNGVPERSYCNKQMICIDFTEVPGASEQILNTLALLMNEIFRTLFAENQAYIVALRPGEGKVPNTYSLYGQDENTLQSNAIYVIEDSQMDIGLVIAVRRNLKRILMIACDYLDWHCAELEKSLNPPPEPEKPDYTVKEPELQPEQKQEEEPESGKKKKKKKRCKLFGRRKKKKDAEEETPMDDSGESRDDNPEESKDGDIKDKPEESKDGDTKDKPEESKDGDTKNKSEEPKDDDAKEQADIHASYMFMDVMPTPEGGSIEYEPEGAIHVDESADGGSLYHRNYYLLYGGEQPPEFLDIKGTSDFLKRLGYGKNALKQAREGKSLAELIAQDYDPTEPGKHFCDFCGVVLTGTEYDILQDGRERCMQCGKTAIHSAEEFVALYEEVLKKMDQFFGVTINVPVQVKMVSAKKLHKRMGIDFKPTSGFDARPIGVAIKDRSGYSLYIENGAPRLSSILTMAHETTHIWQYTHWDLNRIKKMYGPLYLEVVEGMAKWVEVQYAFLINEPAMAMREEINSAMRDDEYGRGFLKYLAVYPVSEGIELPNDTPFMHLDKPL